MKYEIKNIKIKNTNETHKKSNRINKLNNNHFKEIKHNNNKNISINYKEIQQALNKFLKNPNEKYKVNYYFPKEKSLYYWKLTIHGPKNTSYEGGTFNFKLDFTKTFNKITDCVKIENKIYHLNFGDDSGSLNYVIDYIYSKTFYENLMQLFDLLYILLVKPKSELSEEK